MPSHDVVLPEYTAKPAVMRFLLGPDSEFLLAGRAHWLVDHLSALPGVERAMLAVCGNTVSVSKTPEAEWDELGPRVVDYLEELLHRLALMEPEVRLLADSASGGAGEVLRNWVEFGRACWQSLGRSADAAPEPPERAALDRELEVRVRRTLEVELAPLLDAHHCSVELLGVCDGRARLRVESEDASLASALCRRVSAHLQAAIPGIAGIDVG